MKQTFSSTDTNRAAFANDAERMRFALNAAGIGVWEVDIATNEVVWDDRCRELFGLAKDNIIPYSQAIRYIHPDDVENVNAKVQAAIRGDGGGVYDATYRTIGADDGELRWVNFSGSAYLDDNKTLVRFGGIAQDVTKQVAAQQAMEESERRFRSLVEEATVATALYVGHSLRIAYVNNIMLGYWGKDRSVIGKTFREALPELEGQPFPDLLDQVYATGVAYQSPDAEAYLMVDGELKRGFYNFTYKPLFNGDGKVWGIHHMALDVTEQVLSRRAEDEAGARLRGVVTTAPAAISVFLGEDLVVDMPNEAFVEVVGKGPDIAGKPLSVIMPELAGEGQPFLDILKNVYLHGTTFKADAAPVKIRRDGVLREHYFKVTFSPLRDAEGRIYGILDISIDVTDLVKAQQKLEEAQATLKEAIDVANLGTFKVEVAAGKIIVSPRTATWFGFDDLTADVETFISGVGESERDYVRDNLYQAIQAGAEGRYDVVHSIINAKTGQQTIVHAVAKVYFDAAGQPARVEGIAIDITVQHNTQAALEAEVQQRTEELASAVEELKTTNEELATSNTNLLRSNEELAQYAYIASHDLQEPMRKIQIFSDMLTNSHQFPAQLRPILEKVTRSSARMSALIRDLLDFSRVQQADVRLEEVDLQQTIKVVLDDLDRVIKENKATIQIESLPVIKAVPFQMQQLFYNLLGNALKFGRQAVHPVVSIRCMEVVADGHMNKELSREREYHITIEDNGIGFLPEQATKIFEMFKRLHGRNEYAGTGIGLAICKRIVENHHGRIYAEPAAGGGAAFHVLLPKLQGAG